MLDHIQADVDWANETLSNPLRPYDVLGNKPNAKGWGIKKAHLSMSFLSVVRLTYTSRHYITNLTDALIKVK